MAEPISRKSSRSNYVDGSPVDDDKSRTDATESTEADVRVRVTANETIGPAKGPIQDSKDSARLVHAPSLEGIVPARRADGTGDAKKNIASDHNSSREEVRGTVGVISEERGETKFSGPDKALALCPPEDTTVEDASRAEASSNGNSSAPGAFRVMGGMSNTTDGSTTLVDGGSNASGGVEYASLPIGEVVRHNSNIPEAQEVENVTRTRRLIRILIWLLIVIGAGAVVSIAVALTRSNSSPDPTNNALISETSSPSTSVMPSFTPPSATPSALPTFNPSTPHPSKQPSETPTMFPSFSPSMMPVLPMWAQLGQDLDGSSTNHLYGQTVSLSEDGLVLAAGGQFYSANGNQQIGLVRVHSYSNGEWTQLGQDLVGTSTGDWFGDGVAISGDGTTLAIMSGDAVPVVDVYGLTSQVWSPLGQKLSYGYGGDKDSIALSSDGRVLAVGSPLNRTARIYEFVNSNWNQLGQDLTGRLVGDEFGTSVSLSGDGLTMIVGAPGTQDGGGGELNAGETPQTGYAQVHTYSPEDDAWRLLGSNLQGAVIGEQAGWSVALSSDGRIAAIGAVLNDDNGENAGNVRVFQYNVDNLSWLELGNPIVGESSLDNAGFSLDMSADGLTIVIGSPGNKGRPAGDDDIPIDFNAGHARVFVYKESSTMWEQCGAEIDGEATRDQSGYDVSISADGLIVAVGAPLSNGGGRLDAGHVRVHQKPS